MKGQEEHTRGSRTFWVEQAPRGKRKGAAGAEGGARGSCSCVTGSDHGGTLPFLGDRRSHGKVLSRELMACLWLCNSLLVAKWRKMCAGGGGSVGGQKTIQKAVATIYIGAGGLDHSGCG